MRMGVLRSTVLALAVAAALAAPALARDFTDDEKQGLADAIEKFDAAMKASNFGTVIDASIPPKLMTAMAATGGVPADQLKTMIVQQMTQAMQTVKIVSYGMDVENTDYEETADGTPYALVPSEVVMELNGRKVKSSGSTLAIVEASQWYLLNVGQKDQVTVLQTVYPEFADVTFPESKMEAAQ